MNFPQRTATGLLVTTLAFAAGAETWNLLDYSAEHTARVQACAAELGKTATNPVMRAQGCMEFLSGSEFAPLPNAKNIAFKVPDVETFLTAELPKAEIQDREDLRNDALGSVGVAGIVGGLATIAVFEVSSRRKNGKSLFRRNSHTISSI